MRAYSPDLRQKIVDAVRRGLTKTEVARTFSVSRSSVKRYVKIDNELSSLVPSKPIGSAPKIDDTAKRLLESDLEERPAATLAQRRAYLLEITGLLSALWFKRRRLLLRDALYQPCHDAPGLAVSRSLCVQLAAEILDLTLLVLEEALEVWVGNLVTRRVANRVINLDIDMREPFGVLVVLDGAVLYALSHGLGRYSETVCGFGHSQPFHTRLLTP